MGLTKYTHITCNVREYCRLHCFDVSFVTAKAFKPLAEVVPIAAACVGDNAVLHVPVSESQVQKLGLEEPRLRRVGAGFIYYAERVSASRGTESRHMIGFDSIA